MAAVGAETLKAIPRISSSHTVVGPLALLVSNSCELQRFGLGVEACVSNWTWVFARGSSVALYLGVVYLFHLVDTRLRFFHVCLELPSVRVYAQQPNSVRFT